ncbi:DUF58 domain-containing protein [Marinobacter salicampi]|uniref:DUF58 domain-containing protein n=1 Tax=Marinobacter salicampi TaxID=435907 RepID=UPI001409CE6F|nr:DUF58 domain-containing protein [Marinobacter salicampi]
MTSGLKARWNRWVSQRIPRSDSQRFHQRNIFILPSGAGVVFTVLLVIMLITGINYQNSLIYLLTFLLGAVFVAAMHQTHRNLAGFELTLVQPGEGFAGDEIPFVLRGSSPRDDAIAIAFTLPASSGVARRTIDTLTFMEGDTDDLTVLVPAPRRGLQGIDRLRVETGFPFGLLKAWSWMRPEGQGLVYPRPITPPLTMTDIGEGDESAQLRAAFGHDHAEIRPWRAGDMIQRVLWKRYARTGEMVIAKWEGDQGSPHWLDFSAFPGAEAELRLSYLTAQVLERDTAGQVFGLRLPGQVIEPDSGELHLRRCLRALALFGIHQPGTADASHLPSAQSARAAV